MPRLMLALVALATFLLAGAAHAAWTKDVSYAWDGKNTTLKVTDPSGFDVSVEIGDEVKKDTAPAIFTLPAKDAYVWVTIVAKDGAKWREKVEVKAEKQTVLKVLYAPETKPAEATPAQEKVRHFIGKLVNGSQFCGATDRGALRFDFLRDGQKAYGFEVAEGATKSNLDLTEGTYEVRVFILRGGAFEFYQTITKTIDKDGWTLEMGCSKTRKR
jgi:hypothetical protein